jgi:hypothetical protein
VRRFGRERIVRCAGRPAVLLEKRAERNRAKTHAALLQEPAARHVERVLAPKKV